MRTIVEMPEEMVHSLDRIGRREKRPRAALIREAVREYLKGEAGASRESAFGIWVDRGIDGLEMQAALRTEWRDESARHIRSDVD